MAAERDPRFNLKAVNSETRDVLNELDRDYKAPVCHQISSLNLALFLEDLFKEADKLTNIYIYKYKYSFIQ